MKCMLVLALALFAAVYSKELYTAEHDDLDIEAVINDPVQFESFLGCFTDTSECNDLTAHFKKDAAEAIQQACAKCTETQKHLLKRFLEALKEKNLAGYQAMKNKYDPKNKYFAALEAAISN